MKRILFTTILGASLAVLSQFACVAETKEEAKTNPSEIMETYLGDVVADAMKIAMEADAALINGGSLGYENLPDKVNTETLPLLVPFGSDRVVTVKIKGADLDSVIEKSLSLLPRRSTSFLQVSGLSIVCDLNRKTGDRIISIKVGDKELDPGAEYIIATTDFLGSGGGGLTSFRNGKVVSKEGVPLDEIILKNIKYNKTKAGKPDGRIVIIPVKE